MTFFPPKNVRDSLQLLVVLAFTTLAATTSAQSPPPPGAYGGPITVDFGNELVVEALSWEFSNVRPIQIVVGGGDRNGSSPNFSEIKVVRRTDDNSGLILLKTVTVGQEPNMTLTQGNLVITLYEPLLSSYAIEGASYASEPPAEQFTINYTKISFSYNGNGFGWNLETNERFYP